MREWRMRVGRNGSRL